MFNTGNFKYWLIADKFQVDGERYNHPTSRDVWFSSEVYGSSQMCWRNWLTEDPYISLGTTCDYEESKTMFYTNNQYGKSMYQSNEGA